MKKQGRRPPAPTPEVLEYSSVAQLAKCEDKPIPHSWRHADINAFT